MSKTLLTPKQIEEGLHQFTGTEAYHRLSFLPILATDGVAWLCDVAQCHWLIDAIASHQPRCRKDPMLRDMQFWTLKVKDNCKADLICERDKGDKAFCQRIPYTDFPLNEVKLYVQFDGQNTVVMLPSEY